MNQADNTVPKAYLQYLFYDKDSSFVESKTKIINNSSLNNWQKLEETYIMPQKGYIQVFVANSLPRLVGESDKEVWFDEPPVGGQAMKLTLSQHLIVQENHYYPFGMNPPVGGQVIAGIEKEGKPEHRFQLNGQEKHEDFGLAWVSYKYRFYDLTASRFWSVDPIAHEYDDLTPYQFCKQ